MSGTVAILLVGVVCLGNFVGARRHQSPADKMPTLTDCGQTATVPTVDEDLVTRVTTALTEAGWSVRTQAASSVANHRYLQLTREDATALLYLTFLNTPGEAARRIQCDRWMVQQPRSRPVAGLGDEAYVMSVSGLKVRVSNLVFDVNSRARSVELERGIALVVVAAARP